MWFLLRKKCDLVVENKSVLTFRFIYPFSEVEKFIAISKSLSHIALSISIYSVHKGNKKLALTNILLTKLGRSNSRYCCLDCIGKGEPVFFM